MVVDLSRGEEARKVIVSCVFVWAATRAESVRALRIVGGWTEESRQSISAEDFATLVSVVALRVEEMTVRDDDRSRCSLLGPAFARALHVAVAPAGRLRELTLVTTNELPSASWKALGSVTSLEELTVDTAGDGELEFSAEIFTLPRLRRLVDTTRSGVSRPRSLPCEALARSSSVTPTFGGCLTS